MTHYTATMEHSEDTIRQLSKVQYNVFGIRVKMMLVVLCFVWMYFALFSNISSTAQMICLMGGCFTAVSLDLPAKRNADKILEQLDGRKLKSKYAFMEEAFLLSDPDEEDKEPTRVPYTDIIRLVEDRTHYYLFISQFGAYMIDKSTIVPGNGDFRTFMQDACDQKWSLATGLLGVSRKKLKFAKQAARRK